ncbi:unnamed protein product [Calypogeia fissa]
MAAVHRKTPMMANSMMAMLDAKPEVKGMGKIAQDVHNTDPQQFWNDASDNQSPLRKHLISTYLQVPDEEAMPLLGEYFGVALSFVALGALVRAFNSSKRKYKKVMATEEERLDLRACSKFERMALESMLKESMERLGNLSVNAYQLERRVRDLVDETVARDKEKVLLLKRFADAEKLVGELRALRKAEGRANERVMSIVAAKEQDWLKEKRNLQKEIEKLKETVNGMTREAKFQARRCRNPTCEHCKGIDRVVRNVKGRISLRELHSLREASQGPVKRVTSPPQPNRPVEAPRVVERQEIEEDRVLMKAIELKKKQRELSKAEKFQQGGGPINGASQSASKDLLVKQQQDMESELANILKRVGMLKQKSYVGVGPSTSNEATEQVQPSLDNKEDVAVHPEDGIALGRNAGKEILQKVPRIPEPNMHDPTLEVADCASQEESALAELEKAFELKDGQGVSTSGEGSHLVFENGAEGVETRPESEELVENTTSKDGGIPSTSTTEQQQVLDVDQEFLAFQQSLSLGEVGSESNKGVEEVSDVSTDVDTSHVVGDGATASSSQVLEEADSQEQEHTPEAMTDLVHTDNGTDEVDSNGGQEPNPPVQSANEDEQVLGVIDDDEDAAEFSDASSSPLDPMTCEQRNPSAGFVAEQSEQDNTEYGNGMDVKNWGSALGTDGELLENQDIPVFERKNNDDDMAGELPEPEEKRVCGPPETLDSSEALSSPVKETSLQGECLKDKDSATIEEVGSQQEEDPLVEKIGLANAGAKSDEVVLHSQDHLAPADVIS